MHNPLLKQLINFGLSEKEAKIYLALLELGMATVFETAKQSGINRSSAYVVLEALNKKGLVGISDDKKIRNYLAASPEVLLQTAKVAAKKQEETKTAIESIMPELKALHKNNKQKPVVKIFEGKNGMAEAFSDLFSSNDNKLRTFANPANMFKYIPGFKEYDEKRGKSGITMLAINPATEEILELYRHTQAQPPAECLLIPENKFKFSSDMGIYGDKVAFISTKDSLGILIESKEIAEMLKNSFDLAWEESKRLDKKIKKRLKKQTKSN